MRDYRLTGCREVQQWPNSQHWFCPRNASDEDGFYFAEDLTEAGKDIAEELQKSKTKKCDEAKRKTQVVFKALQLFAFDGADAAPHQKWLEDQLGEQMQQCDICIREYHRGRRRFKEELTE